MGFDMYSAPKYMREFSAKAKSEEDLDEFANKQILLAVKEDMTFKLAKAREKGRGGWWHDDCTSEMLWNMLYEHIDKGDFIDVVNFMAMIAVKDYRKDMINSIYTLIDTHELSELHEKSDEMMVDYVMEELSCFMSKYPTKPGWNLPSLKVEDLVVELKSSLHSKGWWFLLKLAAIIHMKNHY